MSGEYLLVIPRLRVQNANAISSPLTHGFPSMTAFLGLMWALERKLMQTDSFELMCDGIGVICHDYQEQVSDSGYHKTFHLTRNPLIQRVQRKFIDKNGQIKPPTILEEGRIHLDISLVFKVRFDLSLDEWREKYLQLVVDTLMTMRIAGGSILPMKNPGLKRYQSQILDVSDFHKVRRQLMPGFALIERTDLLNSRLDELRTENPQATGLDAWLSLSRINWRYQPDEEGNKGTWQHDRAGLGWVVPIPVGYGALSELYEPGAVANARDQTTPFRFVESLYSIGQWVAPYRLSSPEQMLWYVDSQPDKGLYRCRNQFSTDELC